MKDVKARLQGRVDVKTTWAEARETREREAARTERNRMVLICFGV